ncbi:MAG TPA: hypothetical protein VH415_13210 [Nitrososphaeraceae archaeon]|jgi:hypothetical protein
MSSDEEKLATRTDILQMMDGFIEQISKIRTTLKGVSISALILAPLALALSIYIMQHPSFFVLMDNRDEFGIVLVTLLISVIAISSIWIFIGIRQYRLIDSWSRRYDDYLRGKEKIDSEIAANFGSIDDPE